MHNTTQSEQDTYVQLVISILLSLLINPLLSNCMNVIERGYTPRCITTLSIF